MAAGVTFPQTPQHQVAPGWGGRKEGHEPCNLGRASWTVVQMHINNSGHFYFGLGMRCPSPVLLKAMPEIETPVGAAQRAVPAAWRGRHCGDSLCKVSPLPLVSGSWLGYDTPEFSPRLMDAGLPPLGLARQAGRVLHEEGFFQGIPNPCPALPCPCWYCHLPQDTTQCWGL